MLSAITYYHSKDIDAFPTQLDKHPLYGFMWKTLSKEGLLSESIKRQKEIHGVALRAGKFEVVDIDNKIGNAMNILHKIQLFPFYPRLTVVKTQSYGYHLYYKAPNIEGNQKLASHLSIYGTWECVLETRGTGGFIIAPPTKGYKLLQGDITNLNWLTAQERDELINFCRSLNNKPKPPPEPTVHGLTFSAGQIDIAKRCLLSDGWKHIGGFRWRRPGKKEGLSATFGKVAPEVFYVFSSDAHPFEPNKAYTPFHIIKKLMFNDDHAATVKYFREWKD